LLTEKARLLLLFEERLEAVHEYIASSCGGHCFEEEGEIKPLIGTRISRNLGTPSIYLIFECFTEDL
jgi:hypothetical protein